MAVRVMFLSYSEEAVRQLPFSSTQGVVLISCIHSRPSDHAMYADLIWKLVWPS